MDLREDVPETGLDLVVEARLLLASSSVDAAVAPSALAHCVSGEPGAASAVVAVGVASVGVTSIAGITRGVYAARSDLFEHKQRGVKQDVSPRYIARSKAKETLTVRAGHLRHSFPHKGFRAWWTRS